MTRSALGGQPRHHKSPMEGIKHEDCKLIIGKKGPADTYDSHAAPSLAPLKIILIKTI